MKKWGIWIVIWSMAATELYSSELFCKKMADIRECSVAGESFQLIDNSAELPVRLKSGNLQEFRIGDRTVSCFVNSQELECLLPGEKGVSRHLYRRGTLSADKITKILEAVAKDKDQTSIRAPESGPVVGYQNNPYGGIPDSRKSVNADRGRKTFQGVNFSFPPSNGASASDGTEVQGEKKDTGSISDVNVISNTVTDETGRLLARKPWEEYPPNQRLFGDIDGDGSDDVLVWRKSGSEEVGDFYRLSIYRKDGKLLWQSPKSDNSDDPYAFGSWDFGESLPEVLADIDGDGQAELLAPVPASDVSPVYYRIFGWNGHRLVPRRPAVLMCSREETNRFIWVNPYPGDGTEGCWVSSLHPVDSNREAVAELTSLSPEGAKMGRVRVRFDPYGAQIVRWIEPMSRVSEPGVTSAPNQYIARISERDHYNSRGRRLLDLNAILHQDRANFYKGMGDAEDTSAGLFATLRERRRIDRLPVEAVNLPLRELRKEVIDGNPLLRITVSPDRLKVEKLEE